MTLRFLFAVRPRSAHRGSHRDRHTVGLQDITDQERLPHLWPRQGRRVLEIACGAPLGIPARGRLVLDLPRDLCALTRHGNPLTKIALLSIFLLAHANARQPLSIPV